jgi:hypothetical protein
MGGLIMKKVILNKCFGSFDVSPQAYQLYAMKKGYSHLYKYKWAIDSWISPWDIYSDNHLYELIDLFDNSIGHYFTKYFGDKIYKDEISKEDWDNYSLYLGNEHREDPILIEVVEELGDEASGRFGQLIVVQIPDDLDYVIDDYDGIETLHARTETW